MSITILRFFHVVAITFSFFLFFSLKNFFSFCLCWVFVAVGGFSLVSASQSYSLFAVLGLLIAVASVVAEHRL